MTIDAINFLPPVSGIAPTAGDTVPSNAAPSGQFAAWFGQQLGEVNGQLIHADHGIQRLASGDASNLHEVMLNLEQAKVSLQLVMQVRNHLLDAYRELMQMQM